MKQLIIIAVVNIIIIIITLTNSSKLWRIERTYTAIFCSRFL